MNLLRGILSSLLLVLNTIAVCVPLYLLGAARLLFPTRARSSLTRRMDRLIDFWVGNNRRSFNLLGLTSIELSWEGDETLSDDLWYLVVCNHQSWTDIVVLQNILWRRVPPIKFFTKRQLIWVPFLGLAMWFLDFPYVRRMSREQIAADPALAELDRQATLKACEKFREHPSTVLNFPEGTRFTAAKHQNQIARFRNLLNPKIGGLTYVSDGLRNQLHKLLDITIVYLGPTPTFWDLMQGRCPKVQILVQCRDLPESVREALTLEERRERLGLWIEDIWRDKDQRLQRAEEPYSAQTRIEQPG
jgi:1-acyl-sn-glycerol-3-phosphate acyltransferase